MTEVLLLGRRAVREVVRYPEATIPTLFIPLFFLAVNVGQVSKTFPSSTPFLHGQGYAAFQLPVSLLFAVSTATSGLARVNPVSYVIEGLRSLILQGWVLHKLVICLAVCVATALILTWLSVRLIE